MTRRTRVLFALVLAGLLWWLLWPVSTSRAQAPADCAYGFPGSWSCYYLNLPDPSIAVRSVGYGDGSVHYSVCVWGRPGLTLDVLGVWTELRTNERQHMPEARLWHIVATSDEHCEQRQWFASWPGGVWVMDLVELRYRYWAPWT